MRRILSLSFVLLFAIGFATAQLTHSGTFNHVGAVENNEELDFVKAKIAAGEQPWSSQYADLLSWAVTGNTNNVGASENGPRDLCKQAYANALAWHYTGNVTYANQAVTILNAWANNFTGYNVVSGTSNQDLLIAGWIGTLLGPAAELMRDYSGWSATEQAQMTTMFENAFYPAINQMSTWNGNVDLTQIQAMLAIATFNEDVTEFDAGIARLELRNPAYYYLDTDPASARNYGGSSESAWDGNPADGGSDVALWVNGLTQETCRDNTHHAQFALAATLAAAEIAWHQGVDVYAENKTRYVAVLELMAKQLSSGNMQGTCVNNVTGNEYYNTFEIGYNHYHNRMGIAMPETEAYIGSGLNTENSWNIFYEKLTHHGVGGSTTTNPRFSSASLSEDGTTITVSFTKELTNVNTATEINNVTVQVNGINAAIVSMSANAKTITLNLTSALIYSDILTLSYAGGAITDTDSESLEAFSDKNITNNIAPPLTIIFDGENGNQTIFETAWFAYNDSDNNGASTTSPVADVDNFSLSTPGVNGSDSAAALTYYLDKGTYQYNPFVGFGFDLSNIKGVAYDLSSSKGISFWHKGPACTAKISLTTITDYANFGYAIQTDADWTQYTLSWTEFTQPGWGKAVAFDAALITAFQWQIEGATGDTGTLEIDDVAISGEPFTFVINKAILISSIDLATGLSTSAGDNFPANEIAMLETATTAAILVNTDASATQKEIDAATITLNAAIDVFKANENINTNIEEVQQISISASPIPCKDKLTVYSNNETIISIQVLSASGQKIISSQEYSQSVHINTSTLPVGMYFVKTTVESGAIETIKIIK
ncbi:MAG: alginate lyase family protein [Bacteroidales bacterium]|jgi:hypothetical protein|nr:alginate lyase family protein [Bacteroidales bacterium]